MIAKRLALIASLILMPSIANATASLECSGTGDEDVSLLLTLGTAPVLAVVGGRIDTPTESFAFIANAGETEIIVGQGFTDEGTLSVDFVDPNVETILVSLRLVRARGDKELAEAGVLTIRQTEAFAVNCFSG
ncbi:MAG: hypothetical protein AAGI92_07865 [Pseudomonadota bacterium]